MGNFAIAKRLNAPDKPGFYDLCCEAQKPGQRVSGKLSYKKMD
jgi:hypothetical protein